MFLNTIGNNIQAAWDASKISKQSKQVYDQIVVKNESKNLILMKINYYLSKNKLSFNQYPGVIDLIFQQILPMISNPLQKTFEIGKQYENTPMCMQFTESMSFIIERSIIERIKNSSFFSILLDESMDITKEEQFLCYIRYFDHLKSEIRTSFVKIIPLKNQNGAQIFLEVKKYLTNKGLELEKCIGFRCDGASNMTGYRKGVYSFLLKPNPFLVLRHCANHRLALAHTDTVNKVKYINQYVDIISDIYAFFSKSPRRNVLLKKFQAELLEPELSVLKKYSTRWLSLGRCVKNISKMIQSLILTFDEEITLNDSQLTSESLEKYQNVYYQICEYKFLAITFFMLDLLSVVDKLCCQFQSDELNYDSYVTFTKTCFDEIEENYVKNEVYGDNFRVFKEKFKKMNFSQMFELSKENQ